VTWTISSGTCDAKINASETCKSTMLHEKRAQRCTPIRGTDSFEISFFPNFAYVIGLGVVLLGETNLLLKIEA